MCRVVRTIVQADRRGRLGSVQGFSLPPPQRGGAGRELGRRAISVPLRPVILRSPPSRSVAMTGRIGLIPKLITQV